MSKKPGKARTTTARASNGRASNGRASKGHAVLRDGQHVATQSVEGLTDAVHAGEVVGLAGLVGAGRSEIARAIFGVDPSATGELFVRGQRVRIRSPRDALRHGLGFVPEDRRKQGLVLGRRAQATQHALLRLMAGLG